MKMINLEKNFVSPIDQLLNNLENMLPKSASQIKEINQAERIAEARDIKELKTNPELDRNTQ